MLLESSHFGKINYKKSDIIWMTRGLLGFEENKRYVIVSIGGQEPFRWLQSLDDPQLAFLMIDPLFFNQSYAIDLSGKEIAFLGGSKPEDFIFFVLVTIPKGQPEKMTANLQGPVIINRKNMRAAQLVLGDSNYGIRHSIFKEIERKLAATTA